MLYDSVLSCVAVVSDLLETRRCLFLVDELFSLRQFCPPERSIESDCRILGVSGFFFEWVCTFFTFSHVSKRTNKR